MLVRAVKRRGRYEWENAAASSVPSSRCPSAASESPHPMDAERVSRDANRRAEPRTRTYPTVHRMYAL
jgi:hypothetical protein